MFHFKQQLISETAEITSVSSRAEFGLSGFLFLVFGLVWGGRGGEVFGFLGGFCNSNTRNVLCMTFGLFVVVV